MSMHFQLMFWCLELSNIVSESSVTDSGVRPIPYPMAIGGAFLEDKAAGA
jgi:hypothetical protein